MKKTLTLASSLLLLIALTFVGITYWLSAPPPASVNEAENALATKDLIAIAHINNDRINTIMDTVGSDPKSLDIPVLEKGAFADLYHGDGQLKASTQQIVYASNVGESISQSLILQGQFDWENLKGTLTEYYDITPITTPKAMSNTYQLIERELDDGEFICPDERAKIVKQTLYLYASEEWFVFSSQQSQLDTITNRLLTKAAAEVDLDSWRDYRNQQLASIAILVPENVSKAFNGFAAHMAKKASQKNEEISAIYAGIDVNVFEQAIRVSSKIDAVSAWATKTKNAALAQIATMKKDATTLSPTLASFLDNVTIEANQAELVSSLTLKAEDIGKVQAVFREIMSSMFSFKMTREDKVHQESLKTLSWDYKNNDKMKVLKAYTPPSHSGSITFKEGPFGLQLSKVSINDESKLVEVELQNFINTPKIDGWWHLSKAELSLKVDAVTSRSGEEMLRDERCVKDLRFTDANHEVTSGFSANNDVASVSKTLRLKSDSVFSDISTIKGSVGFSLPTDIKIVPLALIEGNHFQQHDVRFYLKEFTQQSITYQLSGETDKLLEVRALNNKGQVLNDNYSMGSSDEKTANFKGDIASIELVVASQKKEVNHNFILTADSFFKEENINSYFLKIRPQTYSKQQWLKNKNVSIKEQAIVEMVSKHYSYDAPHNVANWYSDPIGFIISHDKKSSWGNPKYLSAIPLINELAFSLQAFELSITHTDKNDNNENIVSYLPYSPGHVINKDRSIGELRPYTSVEDIGYLTGAKDLPFTIKSPSLLNKLSGKITVNLPNKISSIDIGKPTFATPYDAQGISVSLIGINNHYAPTYQYQVKAPHLITMIAVLDDGKEVLPEDNPRYANGAWTLVYPLTEKIDHFEVMLATKVDQVVYPFEVTPDYSNK